MRDLSDLLPDFSKLEPPVIGTGPTIDLDDVRLVSFTAEPQQLGPFQSSVISWEVEGPPYGFSVRINGQLVERAGSMRVEPKTTFPYYLRVQTGAASKQLGMIEVGVNLDRCVIDEYPHLHQTVATYLYLWAREETGLRFRGSYNDALGVLVTHGNVHFRMALESVVNNIPNPRVDIEGDFTIIAAGDGVGIGEQRITAVLKSLRVDAYYTTAQSIEVLALSIPGALAAAMAISSAEQEGRAGVPTLLDRIVNTSLIQGVTPPGMNIQNVVILPGTDGLGVLRRTFCPRFKPHRPERPTVDPVVR